MKTTNDIETHGGRLSAAFLALREATEAVFRASEDVHDAEVNLREAKQKILNDYAMDPKALGANEESRKAKLAELVQRQADDLLVCQQVEREARHELDLCGIELSAAKAHSGILDQLARCGAIVLSPVGSAIEAPAPVEAPKTRKRKAEPAAPVSEAVEAEVAVAEAEAVVEETPPAPEAEPVAATQYFADGALVTILWENGITARGVVTAFDNSGSYTVDYEDDGDRKGSGTCVVPASRLVARVMEAAPVVEPAPDKPLSYPDNLNRTLTADEQAEMRALLVGAGYETPQEQYAFIRTIWENHAGVPSMVKVTEFKTLQPILAGKARDRAATFVATSSAEAPEVIPASVAVLEGPAPSDLVTVDQADELRAYARANLPIAEVKAVLRGLTQVDGSPIDNMIQITYAQYVQLRDVDFPAKKAELAESEF